MKKTIGPVAVLLCVVFTAACGEAHTGAGTTSKAVGAAIAVADKAAAGTDSDGDNDSTTAPNGPPDGDDRAIADMGHPARTADRVAIAGLIGAYYAAAAADNGAKACELTYSIQARAIPEDEGATGFGPSSHEPRLTTCPAIMTRTFKRFHAMLSAPVRVTAVRVQGNRAVVLIVSKGLRPGSYTEARREGRVWKIDRYFSGRLP